MAAPQLSFGLDRTSDFKSLYDGMTRPSDSATTRQKPTGSGHSQRFWRPLFERFSRLSPQVVARRMDDCLSGPLRHSAKAAALAIRECDAVSDRLLHSSSLDEGDSPPLFTSSHLHQKNGDEDEGDVSETVDLVTQAVVAESSLSTALGDIRDMDAAIERAAKRLGSAPGLQSTVVHYQNVTFILTERLAKCQRRLRLAVMEHESVKHAVQICLQPALHSGFMPSTGQPAILAHSTPRFPLTEIQQHLATWLKAETPPTVPSRPPVARGHEQNAAISSKSTMRRAVVAPPEGPTLRLDAEEERALADERVSLAMLAQRSQISRVGDAVKVEASVRELASMSNAITENLSLQAEKLAQVEQNTLDAETHIKKGNVEVAQVAAREKWWTPNTVFLAAIWIVVLLLCAMHKIVR